MVAMATGGVNLERVGGLTRTGSLLAIDCFLELPIERTGLTYAGGRNVERSYELTWCLAFPMD